MSQDRKLFEMLKDFAPFAGKLALPYYGKTANVSKKLDRTLTYEGEDVVTVIDHAIQELLLAELVRKDLMHTAFNGEEDTHLKFFFSNDYSKDVTLHCDPIDGTVPFVNGNKRFCVGFGLSRFTKGRHHFFSTVVYAPLEDMLYWSFEKESSVHKKVKKPVNTVSAVNSLNDNGKKAVESLGYSIFRPGTAHLTAIDVSLGRMSAFYLSDANVHDMLVPYSFCKNYGILPANKEGEKFSSFDLDIRHGKVGRIPEIGYFANDKIMNELLPIFQNPKYSLH